MRAILFSLFLLTGILTIQAQISISADDIIASLDAGESIDLENATITGVMDFTAVADQRSDENNGDWNNDGNIRTYVSQSVRFVNCRFEGLVLGYVHIDRRSGDRVLSSNNWNNNRTYLRNADFIEEVVFQNCTFDRDVNFKYSSFEEGASFAGSEFEEDAGFKYTDFGERSDFSQVVFNDDATFKYTSFGEGTSFVEARFEGEATFKYTQFGNGSDLSRAVFRDEANFKYVEFPRDTQMQGTEWGPDPEFKYTTIGGREFRG